MLIAGAFMQQYSFALRRWSSVAHGLAIVAALVWAFVAGALIQTDPYPAR
jgi:hypothetical protein